MVLKKNIYYLLILIIYNSCSYPELERDELIYSTSFNDGETGIEIDGGTVSLYNSEYVLGDFNNDGFTLHLNEIGNHDYIFVSFDLYIHGSWDGNFNGFKENDKPDMWIMELRPDMNLYRDSDFDSFKTTFSNAPCFSNWCLRQSYPDPYPAENRPKMGYHITDLPKKCSDSYYGGPTTLYKLEKSFKHSGNALVLRFYDELYQPNAIDYQGNNVEKCDESWSIDNLRVRAISYK